jgi:aldehyde:ferredoxin oxidoreductase
MDTEAHFARIAATRARGRFIYGEMNWALTGNQQGIFDGEFKANYNEQQFRSRYTVRKRGCFGCPIACMLFIDVPNVGLGLQSCQGFWEPSFSLRIPKFEKVFEFSRMCEMMGVDILSASHTLSAMMELYERGIITEKDTDGLKLEWGNGDNAIKMLKKMVYREGFGDILAEGSMRATRKIGRGAEKYAMHTKGVENAIYDLRGFKGCALATAVSPGHIFRGIPMEYYFRQIEYISPEEKKLYYDFASVFSKNKKAVEPNTYEGKPEAVIFQEHEHMVMDMMGICVWATSWLDIPPEKLYSFDVLELFSTCTGIDNGAVVLEAAERAFNLERAFNVREGLTTKSETLADRYFSDPLPGGVYKGEKLDMKKFEAMKEEYYRLRGWDIQTGLPTPKKLKALGLNGVVNELMLDKNA